MCVKKGIHKLSSGSPVNDSANCVGAGLSPVAPQTWCGMRVTAICPPNGLYI